MCVCVCVCVCAFVCVCALSGMGQNVQITGPARSIARPCLEVMKKYEPLLEFSLKREKNGFKKFVTASRHKLFLKHTSTSHHSHPPELGTCIIFAFFSIVKNDFFFIFIK